MNVARTAPTAVVALALGLALFATAAHAQLWSTPAQRVLLAGRTAPGVRARLAAHADSVLARAPLDAGEAWAWIGWSHLRSGHADSAVAAFRRARALHDITDDAFGLAEALLATRRPADAESAARLVEALPPAEAGSEGVTPFLWRAWAQARLAGPEAAAGPLESARRRLLEPTTAPDVREHWARRIAPLLLEAHGDAWSLLEPLLAVSRGRDAATAGLAREAGIGRRPEGPFERFAASLAAREDSVWAAPMRAAGGRPLAVRTADGFAVSAWLFPAPGRNAPLVALVNEPAPAPGAGPDSLVAQLRREGVAVALLEPRGSRGSAGRGCAFADDWWGREDALAALVARDLEATIGAAIAAGGIDAHRVAAGAVGPRALCAALAARDDARIRALMFVDPLLAPTDRGPFAAALADAGVPAFFQTGPASVEANWIVDRVVAMLPMRQGRVAESRAAGNGLALFGAGPAEARRFSDWLAGAWSSPRATPPAPRR